MPEVNRTKRVASRILTGLLSLLFVFAGATKLIGSEEVLKGFQQFGFPDWFRIFIGVCEVAGGIGLWIGTLALWAIAGLEVIMAGAIWTVVSIGQPPVLPLVVGLLLGVDAWLRRSA